jgi:hypothetical protein
VTNDEPIKPTEMPPTTPVAQTSPPEDVVVVPTERPEPSLVVDGKGDVPVVVAEKVSIDEQKVSSVSEQMPTLLAQTAPVSAVDTREEVLEKPKSSRPRRKKEEPDMMVRMAATPEPTAAEKRALSKRPRRGIRIKGADNT